MNSSEQAYIRDLTALALVNPEMINEGSFCAEAFDEAYENEYMDDLEIMRMALDDAIRRTNDINDIRYYISEIHLCCEMIKQMAKVEKDRREAKESADDV